MLRIFIFRCFFSLFNFQATLSCHWHSTVASKTREGLHQLWALPQLLLIAFFFSSNASSTVLSGHFYPQAFFTLCSFPTFLAHSWHFGTFPTFWHNLLLSWSCWESLVTFLKVTGLHTDPRNTDLTHLFVWFTDILSTIHLNFVFMHVNIAKAFTCGENFDKISSHTIQQPWKYKAAARLISNHEYIFKLLPQKMHFKI